MTVRMERNGKFADVHPDEVANWQAHDWVVIDAESVSASHVVDEFDAEALEPEAKHSLADIVDDRSLLGLAELGVASLADFAAADDADLLDVPYINAKRLAKYRAQIAELMG